MPVPDLSQYHFEKLHQPHPFAWSAIKDRLRFWFSGRRTGRVVSWGWPGVRETFYRDGKKVQENRYEDAKLQIREFNGDTLIERRRIYNNTRRYYDEDVFENQKWVRRESYFKRVLTIYPVKDNAVNGMRESYHIQDGQAVLWETQEMQNGMPNGAFRQFYEDGSLMMSGEKKSEIARKVLKPNDVARLSASQKENLHVVRPEKGEPIYLLENANTYFVGWVDSFYKTGNIESRTFYDQSGHLRDTTRWNEAGEVVEGRHVDDQNIETFFLKDEEGPGFSAIITKQGQQYEVTLDEQGHRSEVKLEPAQHSAQQPLPPFRWPTYKHPSKLKDALFMMTPHPWKHKAARLLFGRNLKKSPKSSGR